MIPPRISGPSQHPPAQIEDAAFVEIGAEPTPAAVKARRVRIRTVLGYAIVGIALLFIVDIAVHSDPRLETGSGVASDGVQAQQMLADWTRRVTGRVNDEGLILMDGPSPPGFTCRDPASNQFIRFGNLRLNEPKGPTLFNAFKMGFADQDNVIEGVFWFDPEASTITISNSALVDTHEKVVRELPDSSIKVTPHGNGVLEFRGVKFHVCDPAALKHRSR